MTVAYKLYKKYTIPELQEMDTKIRQDPINQIPKEANSLYLYTKKARTKLDNIAWAITMHLEDRRKPENEN